MPGCSIPFVRALSDLSCEVSLVVVVHPAEAVFQRGRSSPCLVVIVFFFRCARQLPSRLALFLSVRFVSVRQEVKAAYTTG